ncbi:hypothetical protein Y032_0836g2603 [Ancylostoma ceylanicum]|uniref:Uncharacterized protein n=1 Tax=Ancylostoma ceylanicum TaxID=53326 RepID=A0A016WDD2_9BILA|nr:hypothetical protein Y032_0836g2603 [Ancylostoma ceylanicum]
MREVMLKFSKEDTERQSAGAEHGVGRACGFISYELILIVVGIVSILGILLPIIFDSGSGTLYITAAIKNLNNYPYSNALLKPSVATTRDKTQDGDQNSVVQILWAFIAIIGVINKSQILMILCMVCNLVIAGLVIYNSLHWDGVKTFSHLYRFVVPSIIGEQIHN